MAAVVMEPDGKGGFRELARFRRATASHARARVRQERNEGYFADSRNETPALVELDSDQKTKVCPLREASQTTTYKPSLTHPTTAQPRLARTTARCSAIDPALRADLGAYQTTAPAISDPQPLRATTSSDRLRPTRATPAPSTVLRPCQEELFLFST